MGLLTLDVVTGVFGKNNILEASDFQANPTAAQVGTFGSTPASGWYSSTLSATGVSKLNKTGKTQFRLRFAKDDNNNAIAEYMSFFSGNYSISSSRPILIVTYYVP